MTTMNGWTSGKLGNLCSIEIGGTPTRNISSYWDDAKETSNVWVSIRDMNRRIIDDTAEYITDQGIRHSNAKMQNAGTVLLSFKLTIGRVAFAGKDLYTNEAIAGLRSAELDSHFLFYGLQQWDLLQDVDQAVKGVTLNKDKLRKIEFEYPQSRDEQTQIAAILSTIDKAIEQTEAIIAKQQRIKSGLMQDLLTRGIDAQGNIRSEATHAFKDSPLGRIPVEWEVVKLEQCVLFNAPICYGILMPGSGYDNGIPVIKVKDVFGGEIRQNDLLLTDPRIEHQYKRSRLAAGDLLLTIRGTTGRVAIVPLVLHGANITQDTARIRLTSEYSNKFFYYLLQSQYVQDQILLHTLGQAVKGINIAEVKRLTLGIPDKLEQERIAKILIASNESLNIARMQLDKLTYKKNGLMQDLLTGKVRVTELLKSSPTLAKEVDYALP